MRITLPLAFGIVLGLVARSFAAESQVNQKAIDDVRAGRCKVARAAWWGFQPEESTQALQAAINSGAEKVIVEKMPSPWIVDRIKLAGNQELVFEKGVVVLAKKGAFHGPGDSLFSAAGKSNIKLTGYGAPHVVLQMRRDDYASREYSKAEWRTAPGTHQLHERDHQRAHAGRKRRRRDLPGHQPRQRTLQERRHQRRDLRPQLPARDQRDQRREPAHRELRAEEHGGNQPSRGHRLRAQRPSERLVNCVMRNCLIENNEGYALQIYAPMFDGTTAPMSMRLGKLRDPGHQPRVALHRDLLRAEGTGAGDDRAGHCRFEDAGRAGITVASNSVRGVKIRLCRLHAGRPGREAQRQVAHRVRRRERETWTTSAAWSLPTSRSRKQRTGR